MNSISTLVYLDLNEYSGMGRGVYKNIVTISKPPTGVLSEHVIELKENKLSAFSQENTGCKRIYAVRSFQNSCMLMCEDEIDILIAFLIDNNYTINTEITSMLNNNHRLKRPPNQKNLICYFN